MGWHGIEAAVAVGAGLAASSIALIGFGADSLIESAAGIILLWRFAASRSTSEEAERRAGRRRRRRRRLLRRRLLRAQPSGPIVEPV